MKSIKNLSKKNYQLTAVYWVIILTAIVFLVKVQNVQASLPTGDLLP